jgi:hypothetical protein
MPLDHPSLFTLRFEGGIVKRFLIKLFILFIPFILTAVMGLGVIFPLLLPENAYILSMIDKHRILANSKTPKITLAGGSSVAFGIDSAVIQDRFSIPAVNLGLYAGFGLGRILDDISRFLRTGDVLVILPEYEHFVNLWNGSEVAYELIFNVRQYRLLWPSYYGLPCEFFSFISTQITRIKTIMTSITPNPLAYTRDGFNEYGDFTKHLGMENRPFVSSENLGIINQTSLKNFFRLVDDFTKRGITVILSYPSYEEQSFRNSAALIQELDALFRAKENLLVISSPESYCYPAEYFYDTNYHLNAEGRAVRTGQLIHDLQASGLLP